MKLSRYSHLIFGALVLALVIFNSCKSQKSKADKAVLSVFHAGSLSVPLKVIAEAFEKKFPKVDVQLEASGSVSAVRKLTDLNRSCDVLALADADLIDEWLVPEMASWNLCFATNEIVLAFEPESRYAGKVNEDNWFKIISRPDVKYGRSDPNSDPCGYRTEMCLQLANEYYYEGVDFEHILGKDQRFIRPKASDLIALLESKSVDYIFEYASVAYQHGFSIIELPDEINLSYPKMKLVYQKAEVQIVGKEPGKYQTLIGKPMVYGLTIPMASSNPELAGLFVEFLTDPASGLKLFEQNGQRTIEPFFSEKSVKKPNFKSQ